MEGATPASDALFEESQDGSLPTKEKLKGKGVSLSHGSLVYPHVTTKNHKVAENEGICASALLAEKG